MLLLQGGCPQPATPAPAAAAAGGIRGGGFATTALLDPAVIVPRLLSSDANDGAYATGSDEDSASETDAAEGVGGGSGESCPPRLTLRSAPLHRLQEEEEATSPPFSEANSPSAPVRTLLPRPATPPEPHPLPSSDPSPPLPLESCPPQAQPQPFAHNHHRSFGSSDLSGSNLPLSPSASASSSLVPDPLASALHVQGPASTDSEAESQRDAQPQAVGPRHTRRPSALDTETDVAAITLVTPVPCFGYAAVAETLAAEEPAQPAHTPTTHSSSPSSSSPSPPARASAVEDTPTSPEQPTLHRSFLDESFASTPMSPAAGFAHGSWRSSLPTPTAFTPSQFSHSPSASASPSPSSSPAADAQGGLGAACVELALAHKHVPVFRSRLIALNHARRARAAAAAAEQLAYRRGARVAQEVAFVDRAWADVLRTKRALAAEQADLQRRIQRDQIERALRAHIVAQEAELRWLAANQGAEEKQGHTQSSESPTASHLHSPRSDAHHRGSNSSATATPRSPAVATPAAKTAPCASAASPSAATAPTPPTAVLSLHAGATLAHPTPTSPAAAAGPVSAAAAAAVHVPYFVPSVLRAHAVALDPHQRAQRGTALARRREKHIAQREVHKDRNALLSLAHPAQLVSPRLAAEDANLDPLYARLPAATSPYLNRTACRFDAAGRWDSGQGARDGIDPRHFRVQAYFDPYWPSSDSNHG